MQHSHVSVAASYSIADYSADHSHNDSLESSLYAVVEQCCLWSHCFCVAQNYHCLITHSDRKSSDCIINRNDNDDVIIRVDIREEDSRENLIKEEDEDREDREEDRVLLSSLKEAEREDKSVLISRKICWDNSVSDESINKLYQYLLAIIQTSQQLTVRWRLHLTALSMHIYLYSEQLSRLWRRSHHNKQYNCSQQYL